MELFQKMLTSSADMNRSINVADICPTGLFKTVARIRAFDFRGIDIGIHTVRPPALDGNRFAFEDNLARSALRFVPEYGAIVTSLPIHSLIDVRIKPAKEDQSSSVTNYYLAPAIKKLASSNSPARIVTICQYCHFWIKMRRDNELV